MNAIIITLIKDLLGHKFDTNVLPALNNFEIRPPVGQISKINNFEIRPPVGQISKIVDLVEDEFDTICSPAHYIFQIGHLVGFIEGDRNHIISMLGGGGERTFF